VVGLINFPVPPEAINSVASLWSFAPLLHDVSRTLATLLHAFQAFVCVLAETDEEAVAFTAVPLPLPEWVYPE